MNNDKAKKALARVLNNLAKAILTIKCTFNFLSASDDELGYTFRRRIIGSKKNNEVAEIYINRDHKLLSKLPEYLKNVAAFGVAVHEMLHQKFTNFILFEKVLKATKQEMVNILTTIFNIFEDSRIEYFANQVFGGKALAALKFIINLTWEESLEIDKTAHPLNQILNALIQYGDTGKIKGEFSDPDTRDAFLHCCELFDKAIVCTKCEDCLKLSVECTEYLYNKYLKALAEALKNNMLQGGGGKGEDAKEQKKGSQTANAKQQNRKATMQQESKKSQKRNSSSQNSGNNQQNGDGNSNEEDKNSNEDGNNNSGKASGEENKLGNSENNSQSQGNDTSNDNSDEEGKEVEFNDFVFDDEDIEDFADELESKMEAANEAIEAEVKTSEGDVYTFKLDDAECGVCLYKQIPCDENIFRIYQEYAAAADISGYADELAKDMEVILKTRPTGWERHKSGRLNIKRYCDPNFNSPYIFDKRLSNESSVAVSILIDESGSMTSRIDHVRQMASVLAEAFLKLGIKFNILGHTGGEIDDDTNSIREYSNFDSDVFEQVCTIAARDYNYDGASIKVAADALAKREERNKLMFVLTDGASHNVANTELAIRDANKIGTVIGVALACGRDRDIIEKMYGENFVMVESMNDLMDTIVDKLKEVSCLWS